jgi:stage II sporulation protein M
MRIKRLGEVKIGIIILLAGILIGILFAKIFKGFYWNQIDILDSSYFSKIRTTQINHSVLFQYVMWKNFRIYFLFWIFCITALGIPYMALSIWYAGFQSGFYLAVILMRYGLKGLLLLFGYTFPHFIIYIPVAFLCLRSGYWLCRSMYYDVKMNRRGKAERIAKQMILVLLLGVALIFGGLLETYSGSYILKKILLLF